MAEMEREPKVQCESCKHNIKLSSCGGCATSAIDSLKKINSSFDSELLDLDLYKYACKIVVNNPEDFKIVDPTNCKYFLPRFLQFR